MAVCAAFRWLVKSRWHGDDGMIFISLTVFPVSM